jgi:hypothetical protein
MVFSIAEREIKFRQFIKLRANNTRKSQILRRVGKYLINSTTGINYQNFISRGISEPTYYEWCRIDDNEELFLTVPRNGGQNKKTIPEDDQTLREAALQANWSDMSELRQLPELEDNERIASVCDRTLRRRLRDQGKLTR